MIDTHYYCEKCGREVLPHDCGVVLIPAADLDEAIMWIDVAYGTHDGKNERNERKALGELLTRLRAAKKGG